MFKANNIARWFLLRNKVEQDNDEFIESMTNLKLQKLLYYAQGVHLAITGEPLFCEEIYAWKHGPVVSDVYDIYKSNKGNSIPVNNEADDYEIITELENDSMAIDTLEFVFNEYGQYTAWALRNMTHQERPWIETNINDVIDRCAIKEFFQQEVVELE